MLATRSRPILTLILLTIFLLCQTSVSLAEVYKGDVELDPCVHAAAAAEACGAGSAPLCVSRGGGETEFAGCFSPTTTMPVLTPPAGVGGGTAPPTEPGPDDPVEEVDRGHGDPEEMHGKECGGNPIDIGSGNKYSVETQELEYYRQLEESAMAA